MDRETYEKRRKLGYLDDPSLIVNSAPDASELSPARAMLLLFAGAAVGLICANTTTGRFQVLWALLAIVCVVGLVVLPVYIVYQGSKEVAHKLGWAVIEDQLNKRIPPRPKRRK